MAESNNSSYKNLIVWQKSLNFANEVINMTEKMETDRKHYRLVEQIRSISNVSSDEHR